MTPTIEIGKRIFKISSGSKVEEIVPGGSIYFGHFKGMKLSEIEEILEQKVADDLLKHEDVLKNKVEL